MFGSFPDESLMYFSPALVSHWILEPTFTHMPRLDARLVVIAVPGIIIAAVFG